jgi:N-alpha-acetyl-L-2,4-diaminobutyrate deacetylase
MLEIDNVGMLDTEVERQGKIFVTTELGGAGTASAFSVAIARKGIRNLLKHAGILSGELEEASTKQLDMPDARCFTFAEHVGLVEFLVDLGARVEAGDVIARVWPSDRTGQAPMPCKANRSGILTARHVPGLIQMGDFVALVAVPV